MTKLGPPVSMEQLERLSDEQRMAIGLKLDAMIKSDEFRVFMSLFEMIREHAREGLKTTFGTITPQETAVSIAMNGQYYSAWNDCMDQLEANIPVLAEALKAGKQPGGSDRSDILQPPTTNRGGLL